MKLNGTTSQAGNIINYESLDKILNPGTYTCSIKKKSGSINFADGAIGIYLTKDRTMVTYVSLNYLNTNDKYTTTITINEQTELSSLIYVSKNGMVLTDLEIEWQIEPGSTATDIIAHQEQNYPLTLENIEIYKDGKIEVTYEKQIGGYKKLLSASVINEWEKIILNGTEDWGNWGLQPQTNTKTFVYRNFPSASGFVSSDAGCSYYCNYFVFNNSNSYIYDSELLYINTLKACGVRISSQIVSDLNGFKTWLGSHNLEILYMLPTPTTTPITDTTLLGQLENLINAETYEGGTIITTTGADLAPNTQVIYYRDLTKVINNLENRISLLEE